MISNLSMKESSLSAAAISVMAVEGTVSCFDLAQRTWNSPRDPDGSKGWLRAVESNSYMKSGSTCAAPREESYYLHSWRKSAGGEPTILRLLTPDVRAAAKVFEMCYASLRPEIRD